MTLPRTILLSLLIAIGVFAWLTWPLAIYPDTIPASAQNLVPDDSPRHMWPGDHLQLMYHFWLFGDFMIGKTPFFHDLYEMNTGDDADRLWYHAYYFPFPILFRPVAAFAGRAVAWNVTILVSFWLTYLFTWLLLRRYIKDNWICMLGALVAILFPYRYVTMFGGSPAGFGMMWTPALWLGLEMALRERKVLGGVLAGTAFFMIICCDPHLMYFTGLFLPAMGVISLINMRREEEPWTVKTGLRQVLCLLPAGLGMGLAGAFGWYKRSLFKEKSESLARGLPEVQQYSPDYRSFLVRDTAEVYMGLFLVLLIGGGMLLYLFKAREERPALARWMIGGILGFCVAASMWFSMGTRGPWDTDPIVLARKFIPLYDHIRQPTKIFVYMPLWLSMLAGLSLSAIATRFKHRWTGLVLATGIMALVAAEFQRKLTMKLCSIDYEQAAYAAVAEDSGDEPPRILALPLFDSHDAANSVYMHQVSLYRIRMLNGYSPLVPKGYRETYFEPLKSMNSGTITDAQLDLLHALKIRHLVFHEDMVSKRISPVPAAHLLARLLAHPRLERLKQHDEVWAFRLLQTPRDDIPAVAGLSPTLPVYAHDAEALESSYAGSQLSGEFRACGRSLVILSKPGDHVVFPVILLQESIPGLDAKLRLRGLGTCTFSLRSGEKVLFESNLTVTNRPFAWHTIDLSEVAFDGAAQPRLDLKSGDIDADYCKLGIPDLEDLAPGDRIELNASTMIHEGYSDLDKGAVVYRPEREPWGGTFGTPELAMRPGLYRIELKYSNPDKTPKLHLLNFFSVMAGQLDQNVVVRQGGDAVIETRNEFGLPMSFHMHYPRLAEVHLKSIVISRVE